MINKKESNMFYVVASSQIILYRESLEYTHRQTEQNTNNSPLEPAKKNDV